MNTWFEVDKEGLRKLQEGKPKTMILRELVQNAFDEDIHECAVTIERNRSKIQMTVYDDSPEGFRDISHAYTLFADTYKRRDPEKRGRFNLGEKQVFALCDSVTLTTTKGTLVFDSKGRHNKKERTEKGTVITLQFKGTEKEMQEIIDYANSLIVPEGILFIVNGKVAEKKEPVKRLQARLVTEIEEKGIFKRTVRKAWIEVYESDGRSYLYEMGIPICEIDCDFSINVMQKVPMSFDRETVSQAYLRDVFAEVLNETYDMLPEESASSIWVREATKDERISKEALDSILKKRFGEKVAVANPFDRNSIDDAISNGYNVVMGAEMSKDEWERIKSFGLINSTTELFGKNVVDAPRVEPTDNMKRTADYAKRIAKRILGIDIGVVFVKHSDMVLAQFDRLSNTLTFNVSKLGNGFFSNPVSAGTTELILHELGHYGGSHTESGYHETLTKLGAELTMLALKEPSFFEEAV